MKTLSELLNSEALKPYFEKAESLAKLNNTWSIAMQDFAEHCKVANFEKGELLLLVRNAAWATRIRYAIPEILKTLSSFPEFFSLSRIQCKVAKD